ncbi:MAG: diguanylate cyclase [Candidatus Kuenenia sp.]|nr:diguanylate cyclase [Candidatus Kuenenia sp.]
MESQSANKKTSVLVVDDDPDIRKILNYALRGGGFSVIEAFDGADAFKKFHEEDVDIIISDIMMPGINGLELCKMIKNEETPKKVYFILLSAKGESNDKVVGLELGADEYIPKPFELQEVVARVKTGERIIKLQNTLENSARYYEALAFTDELTKLYNRRFFNEILRKEFANAKRYRHPLSIILLDIDRFKLFNDKYGHPTGDVVLQTVAGVFRETIKRECDIVARYGGEEFSILLTNTQKNSSIEVAEMVRVAVENTKADTDYGKLSVTISLGIGIMEETFSANTPDELFAQADEALLMAKQTGRNKVCCYTQETDKL